MKFLDRQGRNLPNVTNLLQLKCFKIIKNETFQCGLGGDYAIH